MDKTPVASKKYMIIAVLVQIWKFAVRNNSRGVRQESNPQSRTAYSSVRCGSLKVVIL